MLSAYQIRKVIRVYCEKLKEKDVSSHLFSDLEKRMSSAVTQYLQKSQRKATAKKFDDNP